MNVVQGLVAVIKDGKVVCKVIAGCNGGNARKVADYIADNVKDLKFAKLDQIYDLASKLGFDSQGDLVVMDAVEIFSKSKDQISDLYRAKFDDPQFNPRWEVGSANFTEIVTV